MINKKINIVTERIINRSKISRKKYLSQMKNLYSKDFSRSRLSCGNLAHGFAGCNKKEKSNLSKNKVPNIGIITAYNDMLSAHKTYEDYPKKIRKYAEKFNAVAQVSSGVPAMCDGITQGQTGMELSLMSRDIISLSTSIGLSHDMYDSIICLGICDKIVPGLLIGCLKFGHLPTAFLPGGPMETGISNELKSKIRQDFAEGKIDRTALLKGESDSYHSPGTCTFYGTANSNQMLLEIMGLQLPGSSFVNPNSKLRELLNEEIIRILIENSNKKSFEYSLCSIICEKSIVNAIIGLLATGGSTNHTIHLIAIAKSAGIIINWDDFSDLSEIIPLIVKVYPNGNADINHFHASGGMGFVIHTLLQNNLLHEDVNTILGYGLNKFTQEPKIINNKIQWTPGQKFSLNTEIIKPADKPFNLQSGLKIMKGNIGRGVIKTSSLKNPEFKIVAPCVVFNEQEDLIDDFKKNKLNKDFIAVLPFQGPKSNGMPELHKLNPILNVLQNRGYKIALVTDGRMSGASGKTPSIIHVVPEAKDGGLLSKIKSGDVISVNINEGTINCTDKSIEKRKSRIKNNPNLYGNGRELFDNIKMNLSSSEEGASFIV